MGFFSGLSGLIRKSLEGMTLNEALEGHLASMRPGCGTVEYTDAGACAAYRSWVYVAASFNADAVSSGKLGVYAVGDAKVSLTKPVSAIGRKHLARATGKSMPGRVEELVSHPIVDLLNKPNGYDSRASFLFKVDLFLELTGDAYILVERGKAGVPVALHVLYSQFVTIQTDGANRIVSYCYGTARDGKFEYSYEPGQIIHIKFFDPNDQLYGISPLQAAFRSVALINSMSTYEEALNLNMGQPAGVLKYKAKTVSDDQRQVIEQRWGAKFAGNGRAGKLVVTDQDVDYASIGIVPRDMAFMEGRKWSREEVLACYRMPMAMLLTEGVNRSNMEIAKENYHQWTVEPRRRLIAEGLTNGLMRGTLAEGKVVLAFEDDSPIDHAQLMAKSALLANSKAVTRNELRAMLRVGLEDMQDGEQIVGQEAAMVDANRRAAGATNDGSAGAV